MGLRHIKLFEQFNNITRRLVESANSNFSGMVLLADSSSRESMERFAEDLKSSDKSAEALAARIFNAGERALKNLENAWRIRKESGVDEGKLRREGEWYVGSGAWRINSNKAIKLGMKPKWLVSWEDPLHEEIIDSFFPELKGQMSDMEKEREAEIDSVDISDLDDVLQREPVMAESIKPLKYLKRINEANEGAVAPPQGDDDVAVYEPDELIRQLKMTYYNESGRYIPMIWGAPGIGKTAIVKGLAKQISEESGKPIPVMVVTLATFTPTDLGGVPLLFHTGSVQSVEKYTAKPGEEVEDLGDAFPGSEKVILPASMRGQVSQGQTVPGWLPGAADPDEGILFFDEINRADEEMLGASLTLLLDRQTASGRYTIPWGWRVMAAGNRSQDGPVTPLEAAVASRFTAGHFHLVPTIENWIKNVARSEKNGILRYGPPDESGRPKPVLIDGDTQFFIPKEFITYLKSIDGTPGTSKYFNRKGEPIKTDFKAFYYLDQKKLAGSQEGKFTGYPNPRSWTLAWAQIASQILNRPEFLSQVSNDIDSNYKIAGAFEYAMRDSDAMYDIQELLARTVGRTAARDFIDWNKLIGKYSDSKSTLSQKITNVFNAKIEDKDKPFLNIPPVNALDEIQSILSMINLYLEEIDESLTLKQAIRYVAYMVSLVQDGKVKDTAIIGAAISDITSNKDVYPNMFKFLSKFTQTTEAVKKGTATDPTSKEVSKQFKPFIDLFREQLEAISRL